MRIAKIIVLLYLIICPSVSYSQNSRGMIRLNYIPPIPDLESEHLGYSDSWALIIGIDDYKYYPDLKTAVAGAKAFAKKLVTVFNFPKDHVIELYNSDATKENIEKYSEDVFVHKIKKDDRLVIYFGGHGETYANKLGYICPVNARKEKITSTGISMTNLKDLNNIISAKHILYIFDSCFSGMAFARGTLGDFPQSSKSYYKKLINTQSRQAITAGEERELAYDVGPGGKFSPFTYYLLEGLENPQIRDEYNVIHVSYLGEYIRKMVSNYTKGKQNPLVDRFQESGRGDMLIWSKKQYMPLPEQELYNLQGNKVPLKKFMNYASKKYNKQFFLLIYWDYICGPCLRELYYLDKQNLPSNLQVIIINTDNPEDLKMRTLAENLSTRFRGFLNLFPPDNNQRMKIMGKLKINANPLNILTDKDGNIIRSQFGFPSDEKELNLFKKLFKISRN